MSLLDTIKADAEALVARAEGKGEAILTEVEQALHERIAALEAAVAALRKHLGFA